MTSVVYRFVVTHKLYGVLFTVPLDSTFSSTHTHWDGVTAWLKATLAANKAAHDDTLFTCRVFRGLNGALVNNVSQIYFITKEGKT